jgi:2-phosphosulfolactate phosphatase
MRRSLPAVIEWGAGARRGKLARVIDAVFRQDGYDVRLDWGDRGVDALAPACAVLVIVDVLSFSTSTTIAVGNGARVLPLRWRDDRATRQADAAGAVLAGTNGWTLRPASLVNLPAGTLLGLPSPNGATLCAHASTFPGTTVLVGCLRNASAVAALAVALAGSRPVGVIAAGERWGIDIRGEHGDGTALRPCVEDTLGAGAIVKALPGSHSPEAELAVAAFDASSAQLAEVLHACASGQELNVSGNRADVDLAAMHDVSAAAPRLTDGILG